jgi:hypothetical protein
MVDNVLIEKVSELSVKLVVDAEVEEVEENVSEGRSVSENVDVS